MVLKKRLRLISLIATVGASLFSPLVNTLQAEVIPAAPGEAFAQECLGTDTPYEVTLNEVIDTYQAVAAGRTFGQTPDHEWLYYSPIDERAGRAVYRLDYLPEHWDGEHPRAINISSVFQFIQIGDRVGVFGVGSDYRNSRPDNSSPNFWVTYVDDSTLVIEEAVYDDTDSYTCRRTVLFTNGPEATVQYETYREDSSRAEFLYQFDAQNSSVTSEANLSYNAW